MIQNATGRSQRDLPAYDYDFSKLSHETKIIIFSNNVGVGDKVINFFNYEDDIINAIDEINNSPDYSEHCSYAIQSDNQLVLRWSAPSVTEIFDVMVDGDSLIVYDIDGCSSKRQAMETTYMMQL